MKSIADFFKPVATAAAAAKRPASAVVEAPAVAAAAGETENGGSKRARLDSDGDHGGAPHTPPPNAANSSGSGSSSPQPSPEQLRRAEENRQRALQLLEQRRAASAVAGGGSSPTSSDAAPTMPTPTTPSSPNEDPLTELERKTMDPSWLTVLRDEFKKPYFVDLKKFLAKEATQAQIFPPANDIYSWSRLCPFESVRVVIIGQDPYHDDNQAHGLAFSVRRGVRVPPSLVNIYKELQTSIPGFVTPKHGNLEGWSRQGVLLLNTALTVRAHQANSHSNAGWSPFVNAAIKSLSQKRQHLVFILWGRNAQGKAGMIDASKHLVLKGVHPSPLSAASGFYGCNHFNKANEYLKTHGLPPIDWTALDAPPAAVAAAVDAALIR